MKKSFLTLALAIASLAVILLVANFSGGQFSGRQVPVDPTSISSFVECVAAGYPIMESYPAQCRVTETGKSFTQIIDAPTTPPITSGKSCVIGGCSNQICQDAGTEPAITTCEFRPEYACYTSAKCERQTTGSCGWSQTTSLISCLKNPPSLN